jgi:hypothetical protein
VLLQHIPHDLDSLIPYQERQVQLRDTHRPPAFEVDPPHANTFKRIPSHFVDRPTLLEHINGKLDVDYMSRSLVCLHGMTGCGKTVMARSFARSRHFTARFELPGKSKSDFEATLARYAQDIPDLVGDTVSPDPTGIASATAESEALLRWQEDNIIAIVGWLNRKGNYRWLILVDDVELKECDDPKDHWIQHFLDQIHHGTIIITSQSSRFSKIHPNVRVGGLRPRESLLLMAEVLDTDTEVDKPGKYR